MPAADTDTQDSVRARRRRCAEPSRVSYRRRRRLRHCRRASVFDAAANLLFVVFAGFPVVFVSRKSSRPLLHPCLPSDGHPMSTYVDTLRLVVGREHSGFIPGFLMWIWIRRASCPSQGRRRPCLRFPWQHKSANPVRGGALD